MAACSIGNPLTVTGMMEKVLEEGHKAILQTGAASACGRMINRLCKLNGIPVINIVRRDEQVKQLQGEGFELSLNSNSASFLSELQELCN